MVLLLVAAPASTVPPSLDSLLILRVPHVERATLVIQKLGIPFDCPTIGRDSLSMPVRRYRRRTSPGLSVLGRLPTIDDHWRSGVARKVSLLSIPNTVVLDIREEQDAYLMRTAIGGVGCPRLNLKSSSPVKLRRSCHGYLPGRLFRRESLVEVHQPHTVKSAHPPGTKRSRVQRATDQQLAAVQPGLRR